MQGFHVNPSLDIGLRNTACFPQRQLSLGLEPKHPGRQAGTEVSKSWAAESMGTHLLRSLHLWSKKLSWKARNTSIWHHLVTKRIAFLKASKGSDKAHTAPSSNLQMPVIVSSQELRRVQITGHSSPFGLMTDTKPDPSYEADPRSTGIHVGVYFLVKSLWVAEGLNVPHAFLVLYASFLVGHFFRQANLS